MIRLTAVLLAAFAMANAADAGALKFKAKLFGDAALSAKAEYREKQKNAGLERRFKVKIEHADPGEQFDVYVNDLFIDTMTANNMGIAQLKLRTPQFIDSPGDGDPMPNWFPAIGKGDTVVAGAMSGVFFKKKSGKGGKKAQKYKIKGSFDGGDGMDGDVEYREKLKKGKLLRRFKLEVEDAELGDVLPMHVNDIYIGDLVITNDDETEYELRSAWAIDDPGDGDPMPNWFPSLVAGDVVTVGPLSAVLD
jgi:hypothetical protein